MRLRTLLGLLLCAAACGGLALAGTGCGSGATLDPVAQAAENTQHSAGSRMSLTASFTGAGTSFTMAGGGFYDYSRKQGSFTLSASGPALAQLPTGSLKLDERLIGTTVYVGSDLFSGKLPSGARWAKLDLNRLLGAYGVNLQQLWSGGSNPAQLLQFLNGSSGGAREVGTERVRGVMTTRYRGTLDLEKVVDRLPGSVRAQARAGIQKLIAQSGQRFFPIEVWIDAQHRVRRFDMSFTIGAGAQGGTLAMAVELFDYGPTPAVQAPPPAETYDLTQKALGAIGQG